jgi:hypothetical protein
VAREFLTQSFPFEILLKITTSVGVTWPYYSSVGREAGISVQIS